MRSVAATAVATRRVDSVDSAREALGAVVSGRRWVICSEAAVQRRSVDGLRSLGAADVLVVAAVEGVGDLPDCEVVLVDRPGVGSLMSAIRALRAALADPSPDLVATLDRFDPDRSAMVLTDPFMDLDEVAGRIVHGARRAEWAALEDKTTVDALWDEASVARAPSRVVPIVGAAATAASMGSRDGSVWAADNRDGWHGGTEYTRWVAPGSEADATEWFASRADRVRVMPFLDGIPCSIHGFVTNDGVAAFRPYEMVVLRHGTSFAYAGGATFYDPPDGDRAAMRAAARRVGMVLAARVDYRGPFSIDGVMTAEGFLPTELNPRLSRGLADQAASLDGLPIGGLTRAFIDGHVDVDGEWLEEAVVGAADATRMGRAVKAVTGPPPAVGPVDLAVEQGRAVPSDRPVGRLAVGPGALGSVLVFDVLAEAVAPGPSVAPLVAAAFAFAKEAWDLPIPDLAAAPDLRG